eukprot:6538948-Pyramimonas_sp.AAC.1
MAPDVTGFLLGLDTREHSRLEAMVREGAKAEPQKQCQSPTQLGPYECLYCAPEACTRFCEKNKGAVPLQRMQANQMLAVRPT